MVLFFIIPPPPRTIDGLDFHNNLYWKSLIWICGRFAIQIMDFHHIPARTTYITFKYAYRERNDNNQKYFFIPAKINFAWKYWRTLLINCKTVVNLYGVTTRLISRWMYPYRSVVECRGMIVVTKKREEKIGEELLNSWKYRINIDSLKTYLFQYGFRFGMPHDERRLYQIRFFSGNADFQYQSKCNFG